MFKFILEFFIKFLIKFLDFYLINLIKKYIANNVIKKESKKFIVLKGTYPKWINRTANAYPIILLSKKLLPDKIKKHLSINVHKKSMIRIDIQTKKTDPL